MLNKSKLVVVDPDMVWDDVNARPRRRQKQKVVINHEHPDDVENDDNVVMEKNDVNDFQDDENQQQLIDHEEFARATVELPPSACTRAQKRHLSCSPYLEQKRQKTEVPKRKSYAPDEVEQKRQRLEAVELAALFYLF